MLSPRKLSIGKASTYYSRDNYYTNQIGELYGEGLDHLGLKQDDLTHENFTNLLNGVNPKTGEMLTIAKGKNFVPAVDMVFTPPKTFSIAHEASVKYDESLANTLENIHDKAVNTTLNMIEREHVKTRIQKNKKKRVEYTGNMIASKFLHSTSRELDPLIHTHCVVKNLTRGSDGKWRTFDMSSLYKKGSPIVKNLGKYYRQVLKQELQKSGFEIKMTNKKENFFQLKGVDKRLIKEFSKRREAIKKEVEKLRKKFPNMSETDLYQTATLNSRDPKKNVDRDKVRENNLKAMSKYVDIKDMLSKVKQNVKIPTQNIDKKSLTKIIKKAETQITNKYHNTVDNVTDKVITLLPDNVNVDIETVREVVKISKELQMFKKEELKPLKTMHDVAKFQLQKTRFDTSVLRKGNRVKKLNKTQKEEIRENVNARAKSRVKTSYADKVAKRYFAKHARDSKETGRVYFRDSSKFKDFDRDAATARARRIARGRFESERFDADSNRSNRGAKQTSRRQITRAELRSDFKKLQNLQKQKSKSNER